MDVSLREWIRSRLSLVKIHKVLIDIDLISSPTIKIIVGITYLIIPIAAIVCGAIDLRRIKKHLGIEEEEENDKD